MLNLLRRAAPLPCEGEKESESRPFNDGRGRLQGCGVASPSAPAAATNVEPAREYGKCVRQPHGEAATLTLILERRLSKVF